MFRTFPPNASLSFKFVSMVFQCTGGGILVPIFINSIPVALAQDSYAIAIFVSFCMHNWFPKIRDVLTHSVIFKTFMIVLYETMRCSVVTKLTRAAGNAIAPSDFESMAVFGPIICGGIAGCGGAFLPFDKGLKAIESSGLQDNMLTALVAATFYHFFMHTWMSDGVIEAHKKAQLLVAVFFISHNLYTTFGAKLLASPSKSEKTKKE